MRRGSFWDKAAKSLPPAVRERYTAHFEMAERWELALDAAIQAWRRVRTWAGKVLQASPRARYRH